jgi:DNA-binding LacI/PurR family transcriptional regulator
LNGKCNFFVKGTALHTPVIGATCLEHFVLPDTQQAAGNVPEEIHMPTKPSVTKDSRYLQLAAAVRKQIESGELRPGDKLPSFSKMASEMGVMPATFDRTLSVLQQEGLIIREHGRGVFVAPPIQKARYVIAQSPRLLLDDHDPYWSNLFRGVYESCQRHQAEIVFSAQDHGPLAKRVNGMIVYGDPIETFGPVPKDFPFVSLVVPSSGAYCVANDDRTGLSQLTEHLLTLGHRKIAVLYTYPAGSSLIELRLQGYRDALGKAGLPYNPAHVRLLSLTNATMFNSYSDAGFTTMQQWLREDWDKLGCTAIITYNDAAAVGAIRALQAANLKVPQDISVVGFDGNPIFDYFVPRLTSSRVPLVEIGRQGTDLLIRHLQGERDLPERTRLPPQLIIGDSTAPAPSK